MEYDTIDGGPKDYFGMNLSYNEVAAVPGAIPKFNGNISAIKYSTNLGLGIGDPELELFEPTERGYAFRYDALNRLEHADHASKVVSWTSSAFYDEKGLSYDMNGNIKTLSRSGNLNPKMDSLTYDYQGNRLLWVDDAGDDEQGFMDGNIAGTDYLYDQNGNMTSDLNKGISLINYNHLNLPSKVQKNTGEYLRYYYDATGRKLRQEVYNNSNELQKSSDYLGEFFYENDTLRFVNHEEGRVVINEEDPEYQYTLKDHLGNVRLTFSSRIQVETFKATMETATHAQEQSDFQSYGSTINDLLDHTDAGASYNRALVLNGGYNGQIGLAKSFAVMPGDVVSAKAFAKYVGSYGQTSQLVNFAAALTSAFGLTPVSGVDGPTAYSALNDIGGLLATGDHPGDEDEAPKGFLNILVFDRDYTLVDFAFEQLGEEYEQTGALKMAHHELSAEVTIRQAGYVYVYLSNEEANELQIGFDDYEVTVVQNGVVQVDDYYPFGLTFNSYQRENSVENRWKFQGQEHVDDLGLNWDSYRYRNHQADIGRFFNLDPMASAFYYNSPYAFSENKVTSHREMERLEAFFIHGTISDNTTWKKDVADFIMRELKPYFSTDQTADIGFKWDDYVVGGVNRNWLNNNESNRAVAARQLVSYILKNRKAGQKITLVGHSHGGNVAIQAARLLFEKHNVSVNIVNFNTPAWNSANDPENPWDNFGIDEMLHFFTDGDHVAGPLSGSSKYGSLVGGNLKQIELKNPLKSDFAGYNQHLLSNVNWQEVLS